MTNPVTDPLQVSVASIPHITFRVPHSTYPHSLLPVSQVADWWTCGHSQLA